MNEDYYLMIVFSMMAGAHSMHVCDIDKGTPKLNSLPTKKLKIFGGMNINP